MAAEVVEVLEGVVEEHGQALEALDGDEGTRRGVGAASHRGDPVVRREQSW